MPPSSHFRNRPPSEAMSNSRFFCVGTSFARHRGGKRVLSRRLLHACPFVRLKRAGTHARDGPSCSNTRLRLGTDPRKPARKVGRIVLPAARSPWACNLNMESSDPRIEACLAERPLRPPNHGTGQPPPLPKVRWPVRLFSARPQLPSSNSCALCLLPPQVQPRPDDAAKRERYVDFLGFARCPMCTPCRKTGGSGRRVRHIPSLACLAIPDDAERVSSIRRSPIRHFILRNLSCFNRGFPQYPKKAALAAVLQTS